MSEGATTRARRRCLSFAVAVTCLGALRAFANDLTVDPKTLRMNDFGSVIVSLEGAFAANDFVEVPLQNLEFVGEPSVASEFSFINGAITRRKVFRYRVRPLAAGTAQVGPVELTAESGEVERLPAVTLEVAADRASASNDAQVVLRELIAARRDWFFVVAEADKRSAFVGEAVTVTWVMYNATTIQQWQIASIPKLPDFWTEELGRSETPERLYIDDLMLQRLPIRRVALFPLRSGKLRVEGLTVEAAIMRRTRRGPFSLFEGEVAESAFISAPVDLDVKPLPPGPVPDAIGQLSLACDSPTQRGGGPVVINVTLSGLGNVRAALAPRFERGVAGALQIEGGGVTVSRDEGPPRMSRRWRYLILPADSGTLTIPALTMNLFDPAAGIHRQLRCSGTTLDVVAGRAPERASTPVPEAPRRQIPWPWLAGGLAVLVAVLTGAPRGIREWRLRRETQSIVRGRTPGEIRERMEQRVSIDLREQTERGDAWRALRSLLDAAERDRDIGESADQEIVRRVREVLRSARRDKITTEAQRSHGGPQRGHRL